MTKKKSTILAEYNKSNKISFMFKEGFMLFKLVLSYMLIISPFLIYYFSSLELYAYKDLFKINYSFFEDSVIEIKVWNSVMTFIYLLTHSGVKSFIIILLAGLFTLLPFIITQSILQDQDIQNSKLKILGSFIITICYFFLLAALMQFLEISEFFIQGIEKKYLLENASYCQILNKPEEPDTELVISENASVPYKLLFTESSIIYFKPNEPIAIWKTFDSKELKSMKSKCIN